MGTPASRARWIALAVLGSGCILPQDDQPLPGICFATAHCTCGCTICERRDETGACVATQSRLESSVTCVPVEQRGGERCGPAVARVADAGITAGPDAGDRTLRDACAEACAADLRVQGLAVLECVTQSGSIGSNRPECMQSRSDPVVSTTANGTPTSDILICDASRSEVLLVELDGRGNIVKSGRARVFCDVQVQRSSFELTLVRIHGLEMLQFNGTKIDQFAISLVRPLSGTLEADGMYRFDGPQALFMATGLVDGAYTEAGLRPQGEISGTYDLSSRFFTTALTLASQDGKQVMYVALQGVALNRAPVAVIDAPDVAECGAAPTELDGSRSRDLDGTPLVDYLWYVDGNPVGRGARLPVTLPLGTHEVTLFVFDGSRYGKSSTTISVKDTRPPRVSLSFDPSCLWPVDHTLGQNATATVTDACDPNPALLGFTAAESSEPDDALGDGHTTGDVAVAPTFVCLRAERAGLSSEGRTYEVTIMARDASGNAGTATGLVRVSHDQRPDSRCRAAPETMLVVPGDFACIPPTGTSAESRGHSALGEQVPQSTGGCQSARGPSGAWILLALALLRRPRW